MNAESEMKAMYRKKMEHKRWKALRKQKEQKECHKKGCDKNKKMGF